MAKIYAIKKGFDFENNKEIKNLKVNTWNECLKYTKGVKGAIYKSFATEEECDVFFDVGSKKLSDTVDKSEILSIFVDGSYNESTNEFAYGFVAINNDTIIGIGHDKRKSDSENNIRQVAGELLATIKGLEFAITNTNFKNVEIHHDYMGIRNHATGEWARKEKSSVEYYEKMQQLFKKGINVEFVKVDAHTNVLMNELADELCKIKLGIPSDNIISNYLNTNKLYVSNSMIKEVISMLSKNNENVIVRESNVSLESNIPERTVDDEINEILSNLNDNQKELALRLLKSI